MTEGQIKAMFVTKDKTPEGPIITFDIVEDEAGDLFWAYGHVEPKEFITELNRWLVHTLGPGEEIWSDTDDLGKAGFIVEHLYAALDEEQEERWRVVSAHGLAVLQSHQAPAFPVTRLVL